MPGHRLVAAWVACAAAAGLGACGEDEDAYDNTLRPPAPLVVSASVSTERVSVSPRRFGAGPVTVVITNQTDAPQELTLQTDEIGGSAARITQRTGPINPSGTASLEADVRQGLYTVRVQGDQIRAATLRVGPQRPSAQDELLQP